MRPALRKGHTRIRLAWIGLLILGLVHTPLPLPDFHNIRHHDAPGEVCEHHDHLLRWHPGAGAADDVAILHWHWLVPGSERSDATPVPTGKAVHAHVPDGLTADPNTTTAIASASTARELGRLSSPWLAPATPALCDDLPAPDSTLPRFALTNGAPFAPSAPLSSLLQRWDC